VRGAAGKPGLSRAAYTGFFFCFKQTHICVVAGLPGRTAGTIPKGGGEITMGFFKLEEHALPMAAETRLMAGERGPGFAREPRAPSDNGLVSTGNGIAIPGGFDAGTARAALRATPSACRGRLGAASFLVLRPRANKNTMAGQWGPRPARFSAAGDRPGSANWVPGRDRGSVQAGPGPLPKAQNAVLGCRLNLFNLEWPLTSGRFASLPSP